MRARILYQRLLTLGFLVLLVTSPVPAHDFDSAHEAQFEFSVAFITNVWHYPVQTLSVSMECPAEATSTRQAGPVHSAESDCEIHIGAALVDASISDFQFTVLEPPNICKADGSNASWRSSMEALQGSTCNAFGVLRVWPEHLELGRFCSNPGHVLEVHPLLALDCDNGSQFDFRDMLFVPEDLGFKEPERAREMMDMHLWLRQDGSVPGGTSTVSFDYGFGFNHGRGHASNFARLRVRVLPEFIRTSTDSNDNSRGFATVIARVLPVDEDGFSDAPHWEMLKIYAVEGTPFFDNLMARVGTTGSGEEFDIVGIFSFDSLSIIKVIEHPDTPAGEWVDVPYPVSFIAFGERP